MPALVAGAMLLSHPYTGIRHDGILYFGDALARLVPGELHDDLYFYYGSQGRFTLLPAAYAWLIHAAGIGNGTIVGLVVALTLQLAATLYVVRLLASPKMRVYCALSVVLGWAIYGGLRIFSYGESFLTARSFAEPIVLFALAMVFRGRLVRGALALAVAMTLHPLMGIGGVVVAWAFLCLFDRRWLWAGLAALVVYAALGWWGHAPFDDVFGRYDETWYALVREANPQAFVTLWRMTDFGAIAYSSVVLWLVSRRVDSVVVRRVALAALLGGLLCVAISYVGVDLLRNPFLGKLQVWRALWVSQWFAMATFPLLAVALWNRGESGKTAALLLVIGWMAAFSVAPAIVAVLALAIDVAGPRAKLSRTTTRIVGGLVLIAAMIIAGQYWARTIKLGIVLEQPWGRIVAQLLSMNVMIAVVAVVAMRSKLRRPWLGSFLAMALFAAGLATWDQRSEWTKRMESFAIGTNIWPGLIAADARVYWYRDLIAPWILLEHANFYTQQQGSGAVFSRDMMVELERRRKVTAILDFQEQLCRMMNNLNEKEHSCEPDAEAVKSVCTEGGIDYVILQSGLQGTRPTASFATGVVENGYEKSFFLYRCSALGPG